MGKVAHGLSNREIASQLGISEQAVKEQVSLLLLRLGVRNRAALAEVGTRAAIVGDVASTDWLPFLFRSAPMLIAFLRGPEHLVEAVNEQGLTMAGQRELAGMPFRSAYPEMPPEIVALMDDAYRDGRTRTLGAVPSRWDRRGAGVDEDGVMTVVVQPVPAREPANVGVLVFAIDVTDA
jgi:regulatory LuxR family protein